MYSKYEVTISEDFYMREIEPYIRWGQVIYSKEEIEAQGVLDNYLLNNSCLDGDKIKEEWFPKKKVDIFICHSHKDMERVKAFAGWLYDTFELKCFIDSCVWGYCNTLLRIIDERYCKNPHENTYDYNKRNYSTSHVHMMLSIALTEMMNLSECVMFYNTPNSVSVIDELIQVNCEKDNHSKITISPWIYHELSMSSYIKIKRPERGIRVVTCDSALNETRKSGELTIQYAVSEHLNKLISLSDIELETWKREYSKTVGEVHPLDVLYNLKGKKQI